MKTVISTLFFFLFSSLFFLASAQQVIYVKHDATGNNDGTSWANAYTDLNSALAAEPPPDTVWIAQGIYKPGSTSIATFRIEDNMVLLGGFNGSGTNPDDRNPEMYETILSGDINGDDVEDDFETNRADNVMRVVTINWGMSNETIIDGFTICNGHADGGTTAQQRGAGIHSPNAAPIIKNCFFTQNYANNSGGGLYFNESQSQNALVQDCRFEKNRADNWTGGGGIHIRDVGGNGVTVENVVFDLNEGGRGSGLSCFGSNVKVRTSTFSNNTNEQQGGSLWFWGEYANRSLEVDDCVFYNNHSSFGGALYFLAPESNNSLQITNSTFLGNFVDPNDMGWGQGGGGMCIYVAEDTYNNSITIDSCQFSGNSSSSRGGGIENHINGNSVNYNISDCSFYNNTSIYDNAAIGFNMGGAGIEIEINRCQFSKNNSGEEAAVGIWATGESNGSVLLDSCVFESNTAIYAGGLEIGVGGGAVYDFTVSNSEFRNNEAMEGGALLLLCDATSAANFLVDNCIIEGNEATISGGGISIFGSSQDFHARISHSKIKNNQSQDGGAVDQYHFFQVGSIPKEATITFDNCLITGNTSDNAAFSFEEFPNLNFLNCTVADNTGGGIELSDLSGLTLQNTILHNPGNAEFEAVTNDVTVSSNGGNLIGDSSLIDYALGSDLQNADPLFETSGDDCEYYQPGMGSPIIDNGVALVDAPELDLCSQQRVFGEGIDIGAIELVIVPVKEVVVGELKISPNPATDFLYIQFPEPNINPVKVSLFDFQGKLVKHQIISANQSIDVKSLLPGMYLLKAMDDEKIYTGKFVKH